MRLNEEILRMKSIMGLIMEQSTSTTITLPYPVSHSYPRPSDCDELHAFESTSSNSKKIGEMNTKVKAALDLCKQQGLKVWVSDVSVTISKTQVSYTVTISESDDGEFWGGFTSRGAGCNRDILNRWNNESVGNGPKSIVANIINDKDKLGNPKNPVCKSVKNIELVKRIDYTNLGGSSFIQGFYRYKCGEHNQTKSTTSNSEDNTSNVKPYSIDFKDQEDPNKLRTALKDLSKNNNLYDPEVKIDFSNKIINIYSKKSGDKVSLSYIYSDSGELDAVLSKVADPATGNNVFKTQNLDMGRFKGYIIHMHI